MEGTSLTLVGDPSSDGVTIKIPYGVDSFFNWDSLHARLNSHYEEWSYKKKEYKKIRAHRKSV